MEYTYRIHPIPTTDPLLLAFYAGKYSTLRLNSLTVSASAFGSTLAREAAFTPQQWIKVITRPRNQVFIAVAYPSSVPPEDQTLERGDWVACGTLIGPTPKEEFEIKESGGEVVREDEVERKWHMSCVFNRLDHRGKGVAKLLIQEAFEFTAAEARATGHSLTRTRIMVHPDNVLVKKLYSSVGFVDSGKVTFLEAVYANSDPELAPADGGKSDPAKYHTRYGSIMERFAEVK